MSDREIDRPACPHCGESYVYHWGGDSFGVVEFECSRCDRTFTARR